MVLIVAPYLYAYWQNGSDHFFGGFLLNPIDGNSYLAKMYQGWLGNWLSHLPYTSQPGDGAYLFMFYLALGHIARVSGFSLQLTYHIARIIGSFALLVAIWSFYRKVLPTQRSQRLAFGLALFGSGLGWLAAVFGAFTADLWVAEGYPFLSAYANPHFPLGMAIMIWILSPGSFIQVDSQGKSGFRAVFLLFALSLILSIILPFGVVVAGTVLAGMALWESWKGLINLKKTSWTASQVFRILCISEASQKLFWLCLGGLPVFLYEGWIIRSDPIFAIWNSQNLTVSPPLWDLFASFTPVLLLGLLGGWIIFRDRYPDTRTLVVWSSLGLLLIYLPLGLQRRFILGYLIPLAGLAGIGLDFIFRNKRRLGLVVLIVFIILAFPTNLMIILGGVQAVNSGNPSIYLTQNERNALAWIEANTTPNSLILASPQMGLFIPAYTGRRVLYGHPFETINADKMEIMVLLLLKGNVDEADLSTLNNIDYLFFGPRERELVDFPNQQNMKVVFSSGGTRVYKYID